MNNTPYPIFIPMHKVMIVWDYLGPPKFLQNLHIYNGERHRKKEKFLTQQFSRGICNNGWKSLNYEEVLMEMMEIILEYSPQNMRSFLLQFAKIEEFEKIRKYIWRKYYEDEWPRYDNWKRELFHIVLGDEHNLGFIRLDD